MSRSNPRCASVIVIVCLSMLPLTDMHGQSFRTVSTTRMARGETALNVRVRFAAGTLFLRPGSGNRLYQGEIYYDADRFDSNTDYDLDGRTLNFGLDSRDGKTHLGRLETTQRMELSLSPDVPTRLRLELGAVEAGIELGGMTVISVDLTTGAASTRLSFSEPTRGECQALNLKVAAAEFVGERLSNSRCRKVSFAGGVGEIMLDFTGDWANGDTREAEIELGLGQLTLSLPKGLGVAIEVDRFLASFDQAGFRKRGSRYVSENYETASKRLLISIKAVLGDIAIEWVGR